MTADQYDALRTQLIAHEGSRLFPYTDTRGKLTIGIGRNLTDCGITEHEQNYLYENDVEIVLRGLTRELPWFLRLDPVRQRVLIDLGFNLGVEGLLTFNEFLELVRTGLYSSAAEDLLRTKYAHQVPSRAQRLAALMRVGETT